MDNLSDLATHLFTQIERLEDEKLKGDELKEAIERSTAVCKVSNQIVGVANVILDGAKFNNSPNGYHEAPELLIGNKNDNT